MHPAVRVVAIATLASLALPLTGALTWYGRPDRLSGISAIERARVALRARLNAPEDRRAVALVRDLAHKDDWFTFAHDDRRSGFQPGAIGLDASSVRGLTERWMRTLGEPVRASPIVVGGSVYVATDQGTVFALDAADGAIRWRRKVGNSVRMTPALVHGALLVGVYGALGAVGTKAHGAAFLALDARSGRIRWRTPLPGLLRSEPVVLGGTIFEGLAGGDAFSGCFDGRVIALDERTGAPLPPVWRTSARTNNGGGIWGPLSTDGTTMYVGTGNTCDEKPADGGDSIVALSRTLAPRWLTSARVAGVADSDVGGGVVLDGPHAFVAGKSGYLYQLDRATGRIEARRDLAPWARNGGSIGTPTGDGSVLVISGGEKSDPSSPTVPACVITGFDRAGHVLYRLYSDRAVTAGYAAFVRGVGFIVLDRRLVAFAAASGAELWSAPLGDFAYASPVVVPSGVYAANDAGDVFAFGLERSPPFQERNRARTGTPPRTASTMTTPNAPQ